MGEWLGMRVALVEPYLQSRTGHYYNTVSQVEAGFRELGHEVDIFIPRHSEIADLGQKAIPYSLTGVRGMPILPKIAWNLRYIHGLTGFLQSYISDYDLCLVTTSDNWETLYAASRVRSHTPIYLYLHALVISYAKARFLRPLVDLNFNRTTNPIIFLHPTSLGRNLFQRKITSANVDLICDVPLPMAPLSEEKLKTISKSEAPSEETDFIISYMGDVRLEKGFPAVVRLVSECNESYKFTIQCIPPASGYEPGALGWVDCLKAISKRQSNVTLIERPLSSDEFSKQISMSSIVLCLYEPQWYSNRMSGVLLETFPHGKPVIVVRGSSLADQVERHGGGVIVDDVEPETVIRAIDTIRMDYKKFSDEALAAGDELRRFNTGANLARIIIEDLEQRHRRI